MRLLTFCKKTLLNIHVAFARLTDVLRHFEIYYNDKEIAVEQVEEAVRNELDGPESYSATD